MLGFQTIQVDKIFTELTKLWQVYKQNPQLTPAIELNQNESTKSWQEVETQDDDVQIIEEDYNSNNKNINQYLESIDQNQMEIVLSDELGLAIQKPNDTSVQDLWKIINVKK